MIVQGYRVINLLLAELGLPTTMPVKSMTVRADVPGGVSVTLECLVPKAEGGALARAVAERRWVMVEDTDEARILHGTGAYAARGITDAGRAIPPTRR